MESSKRQLVIHRNRWAPLTALLLMAVAVVPFAPSIASADSPTTAPSSGSTAVAPPLSDREKSEIERTNRLWKQFWRDYANRAIFFENRYVICPAYDPQFPSSRGVTVDQCLSPTSGIQGAPMAPQEAQLNAMAIPELSVGQYGYLYSGEVAKVIGQNDAVLRNIKYVDEESIAQDYQAQSDKIFARVEEYQRQTWDKLRKNIDFNTTRQQFQDQLDLSFKHRRDLAHAQEQLGFDFQLHIKGFDTGKMLSGARWAGESNAGFQIAVIGVESFSDNFENHKQRLVAIPVEKFKTPLNEEQFRKLLVQCHVTPTQFVDAVLAEKRKDPIGYKVNVMKFLKTSGEMDEHPFQSPTPEADAQPQ